MEQFVAPNQLRAWIQPLRLDRAEPTAEGMRIKMIAPNDFSANWVRDQYKRALEDSFSQVMGARCEISVSSDQERGAQEGAAIDLEQGETPNLNFGHQQGSLGSASPIESLAQNQDRPSTQATGGSRRGHEARLDPKYTFETFIVGASNQFAHASAVAVAESPARQYNPLFLYSPPGLGKTHLLHAIGLHILSKAPNTRIAFLSAEEFVNELIDSLKQQKMTQFRMKFRDSFDVVLIDDIQFIAGKTACEEEFFHTFNALHNAKRQIVVTSDRPPKEIERLEERIRTRFEWGLVVDIIPPEIETRIAILRSKSERDDIYLPDDVATFLATYIKSNVRELEGVLIRLQAQASLSGAEISLEMAKQLLKTVVPEEGTKYTVEAIQNAVVKHYRIKIQDLKSERRTKNIAFPRQIAMYLVRKYTNLGFKEIGVTFAKDYSTIIHACNRIERDIETDPAVRDVVEKIQNLL